MAKCDVCARDAMEVYSIDEFGMCSQCITAGRVNELPPFRTNGGAEVDAGSARLSRVARSDNPRPRRSAEP